MNSHSTPFYATATSQHDVYEQGVEVLAPATYTATTVEEAALNAEKEVRSHLQIDSETLSAIWDD